MIETWIIDENGSLIFDFDWSKIYSKEANKKLVFELPVTFYASHPSQSPGESVSQDFSEIAMLFGWGELTMMMKKVREVATSCREETLTLSKFGASVPAVKVQIQGILKSWHCRMLNKN